jgi:3',5'-nucleoside bisphosphate phosphatase
VPNLIRADLHLHTCLSPCADLLMSPRTVVQQAVKKNLDVIAICDHNSAENVWAAVKAGRKVGITVLPGMEITSREEVHILGWFPSVEAALEVQAKVYGALPGENDPDRFGLQIIADENDNVTDFCSRLLIGATTLGLEDIIRVIHRAGGLAVASHIDREGFGIIGQLGFIPPDLKLDALEVSRAMGLEKARETYSEYTNLFPLTCSSDAHEVADIGLGFTKFEAEEATFEGIKAALIK